MHEVFGPVHRAPPFYDRLEVRDVVDARGAAELHDLVGSPTKARTVLGWEPTIGLLELVKPLVDCELEALSGPAEAQSASSA